MCAMPIITTFLGQKNFVFFVATFSYQSVTTLLISHIVLLCRHIDMFFRVQFKTFLKGTSLNQRSNDHRHEMRGDNNFKEMQEQLSNITEAVEVLVSV